MDSIEYIIGAVIALVTSIAGAIFAFIKKMKNRK